MVRQRPAKPLPPVRIRFPPPLLIKPRKRLFCCKQRREFQAAETINPRLRGTRFDCEAGIAEPFRPLQKHGSLTWANASGRNQRRPKRATPAAQSQSRGRNGPIPAAQSRSRSIAWGRGANLGVESVAMLLCGACPCQFDSRKNNLDIRIDTAQCFRLPN